MHSLTPQALAELAAFTSPPCLSLYQPTHRRHPENQQDPIRFRQGVKALEVSLRQQHPAAETRALLAPFHALAEDADFWNHTLDGIAVLGGPGLFRVFVLARPVEELAVVADSFHTKPLRRFVQSVGRFQVLGLSRHGIRLFEGDRDGIDEIELASGVPRTVTEALGDELTEPHHTVSSYGGIGGARSPMHHGQGGKKDEVDLDAERFFRAVDRAVTEHHSKPSGLPLILAALPEHHHLFRQVSHNALLLPSGIDVNPDALSPDQLRERAWQAVAPQFLAQQARSRGGREDGRPGARATGRAHAQYGGAGGHLPPLTTSESTAMKIQVNTGAHVEGREALATQVDATVEHALRRFQDQVTRVEVHLSDQNGTKSGRRDKRCAMEARLEGRQPLTVTDDAATLDQAVRGAADKLARLIDSQLGRVASTDRSPVKPPAP
jgi:hypothetical protein